LPPRRFGNRTAHHGLAAGAWRISAGSISTWRMRFLAQV
jgi:hypothetical protein